MLQIRNILDASYKIMLEVQKTKMLFSINDWASCQFLPEKTKNFSNNLIH